MKIGGSRNFGYGKNLAWAAKNALRERYGLGHFDTVATHAARFEQFAVFCRSSGISDARRVTQDMLIHYAKLLCGLVRSDELKVATAQNLISSVNITLHAFRKDDHIWVSPRAMVGAHSSVRTEPPLYQQPEAVRILQMKLCQRGAVRVAAMVNLARELGLRFREAVLLNAKAALAAAEKYNRIIIVTGTKGGRPRELTITNTQQLEALRYAASVQYEDRNMIPAGMNYKQYRDHAYYEFYAAGGCHFHDLRAAYACQRYEQLARCLAPVWRRADDPRPSKEVDYEARMTLAIDLGHGRIDVIAAYVGGRK